MEPLAAAEEDTLIENVPYVWQRIDGLCDPAAVTAVLRFYEADVTLDRVLNLSGAGWGMMYLRQDSPPNWLFIIGVTGSQLEDTKFLADALGFSWTLYSSVNVPGADDLGIDTHILDGWDEAWEMLTSTLDAGDPVVLSVDPAYLPPTEYNAIRHQNLVGLGHGVVAVGYNEVGVTVMDPGIGIFGDNYGHLSDDQGIYKVQMENFREAWEKRYFIGLVFARTDEPKSIINMAVRRIHDKLAPPEDLTSVYPLAYRNWSLGYKVYGDLADDMHPDNFKSMMVSWLDYFDDNREMLIATCENVIRPLVRNFTLTQYLLNYSVADLAELTGSVGGDYEKVISEFQDAVLNFENLTDNYVLLYPFGEERSKITLIDNVFTTFVEALREGATLDSAVESITPELEELSATFSRITSHLKKGVEYLPSPSKPSRGPIIEIILIIVVVAFALVFYWRFAR